ncbi:MAG: hypothetical protein KJ011_08390 [Burkholderiaceae bacterium]|nr:hypothetical protein [Burkholderiaceae bacterium]
MPCPLADAAETPAADTVLDEVTVRETAPPRLVETRVGFVTDPGEGSAQFSPPAGET